jgi:DNA-binding LacI/PurR family transcriptional regulator
MNDRRGSITIKDIAQRLGVSHSTVSRSLRDSPLIGAETKDRVRKAALELGYVVHAAARQMRGEPSPLIGLILPDVRPDFFSALTTTFAKASARRGLNLLLSVSQNDARIEEAQIRALREARVSGILIYPTIDLTSGSRALLGSVSTVQIARRHPGFDAPFVGTEDTKSMATLIRHLVDLGHRRIAYIGSDPTLSPGGERLQAFEATMRSLDMPIDRTLIGLGMATAEAGSDVARRLLSLEPQPTALAVASAPMAEGALDVVQQMGLSLPGDLSFTGFGDPFWYRSWGPGITSVAMPVDKVVDLALGRLLDDDGGGTSLPPTIRVPSEVVLRGTTGKPRS